jgi:hypothetical protein
VTRKQYPWVITGILVVAWAGWHLPGLVLAAAGLAVVYLASLRTHPRIRHTGWRGCGGSGEVRHRLFPWVFHRCGRCNSGRLVRWGAGQWGSGPVRAERRRLATARARARDSRSWR